MPRPARPSPRASVRHVDSGSWRSPRNDWASYTAPRARADRTGRKIESAGRIDPRDEPECPLDLAAKRRVLELQRPRLIYQRVVERAANHLEREADVLDLVFAERSPEHARVALHEARDGELAELAKLLPELRIRGAALQGRAPQVGMLEHEAELALHRPRHDRLHRHAVVPAL